MARFRKSTRIYHLRNLKLQLLISVLNFICRLLHFVILVWKLRYLIAVKFLSFTFMLHLRIFPWWCLILVILLPATLKYLVPLSFFLESANLQVLISQLPAYSKPALEMLFFYESTVSNSSCPLSTINNIFFVFPVSFLLKCL